MGKQKFNKVNILLSYCVIAIILVCCSFINITLSWLSITDTTATTDGTTFMPTTSLEFYNGTTKLDGPHTFTTDNAGNVTNLNIYVKNTSNARVIIRLFYAFYMGDSTEQIATSTQFSNLTYGNFWLTHEHLPNTYSGYLFFDGAVEANSYVKLFDTVTATSDGANLQYTLNITGECVLYNGNAYTMGIEEKYPWESYPEGWLNEIYFNGWENQEPGTDVTNTWVGVSGATVEVVTDENAPTGNKVLKLTGTGGFDEATGYNRIQGVYHVDNPDTGAYNILSGYKYVYSAFYKCDGWYSSSTVFGSPLYAQKEDKSGAYKIFIDNNYSKNGYEFLSVEVEIASNDARFYLHAAVPGKGMIAYLDNFYLTRVCGTETI